MINSVNARICTIYFKEGKVLQGKLMRAIVAINLCLLGVLTATASHATTFTWTTLDAPGAVGTDLYAISGSNIYGSYTDSSGDIHGTIYDGSSWTTLDHPSATAGTYLSGVEGNKIVGNYYVGGTSHGLIYEGSSWSTVDHPTAANTFFEQIDGSNIVGNISTGVANNWQGVLYDGSSWTTLDYPSAASTSAYDIDGNKIVGAYRVGPYSSGTFHGYVYDGSSYTALNYPGATSTWIIC